jgi:hypothetical protein
MQLRATCKALTNRQNPETAREFVPVRRIRYGGYVLGRYREQLNDGYRLTLISFLTNPFQTKSLVEPIDSGEARRFVCGRKHCASFIDILLEGLRWCSLPNRSELTDRQCRA